LTSAASKIVGWACKLKERKNNTKQNTFGVNWGLQFRVFFMYCKQFFFIAFTRMRILTN